MLESSPFGSRSRTRILLALGRRESSYPRELARDLDTPIFAVRKALDSLARDGLVTSRAVGRTRVYTLDPAYPAFKELAALLARLATAQEIQSRPQFPQPITNLLPGEIARQPARPANAGPVEPPRPAPGPEEGWRNW